MSLLDLIRGKLTLEVATAIHAIPATTQPESGQAVAKIAKVQVANPKAVKSDISIAGVKSRWWLVHFRDKAPTEICCNPIAVADQVLRDIAGAVYAEAIADGSSELDSPDQYGHWSDSGTRLTKQRTHLFVMRGVLFEVADTLACSLVDRDRSGDDRRSCAECDMYDHSCVRGLEPFSGGGVEVLHRCKGFTDHI